MWLWFVEFISRLRDVLTRQRLEREAKREITAHLELLAAENIRRGMTPADAHRQAHARFGGITQAKESLREQIGFPGLESIALDVRYAMRGLARDRGFAAAAVGMLVLGIGLSATGFSVVDVALLQPPPFSEPDQLGIVSEVLHESPAARERVSYPNFRDWQKQGAAVATLAAMRSRDFFRARRDGRARQNLQQATGVRSVAVADGMLIDFDYRLFRVGRTNGAEFVTTQVTRVGEQFLETIGASLLRGRTIEAEDRTLAAPVAVISEPLAEQLFPATDPLGERVTVTLDQSRAQEFTIVGVSADFATSQLTTERPQILLPLPEDIASSVYLIVRGVPDDDPKLRVALENVIRELDVDAVPSALMVFRGIVTGQDLLRKSRSDLISESIAVAFAGSVVLVLAGLGILGVVGFMVAARQREIAVRMALGATRPGVFGLVLSDVVKLVVPGVAGGLTLAAVLIRTMEEVMGTPLTLGPTPLGRMEPLIYVLASAIAVAVALLAGLPTARRATTVQPMVAMRLE